MQRGIRILIGMILLFFLIFSARSFVISVQRLGEAENVLAGLEITAQKLRDEKCSLLSRIDVWHETDTLASAARERLGLVSPDDKVFVDYSD